MTTKLCYLFQVQQSPTSSPPPFTMLERKQATVSGEKYNISLGGGGVGDFVSMRRVQLFAKGNCSFATHSTTFFPLG